MTDTMTSQNIVLSSWDTLYICIVDSEVLMIIQLIIEATGIVTRSLRKNFEYLTGKHSIDSQQKTAILRTSLIMRKVLQCGTGRVSGGDRHWFRGRGAGEERAVTGEI
jgi:hypothetical protein